MFAPVSKLECLGDLFDLKETERLTEQLNAIIDSVFCAPDSKNLVGIMPDWAKTYRRKAGPRDALRAPARM
jgi:hypothetical protein